MHHLHVNYTTAVQCRIDFTLFCGVALEGVLEMECIVIEVVGGIGSGKSTFINRIVEKMMWRLIS